MKAFDKLKAIQEKNKSTLCVGLDSDISKIPAQFSKDINGLLEFNKTIIKATEKHACAYKINFAFYEQYGADGFNAIEETLKLIPRNIYTIADAKRGDIGNTSAAYSRAILEAMNFDSITVNPYMGSDCVMPFLENKDKMVFLLALTSNKGSEDFQLLDLGGMKLYQKIIETTSKWSDETNIAYVVGATHPEYVAGIREQIPNNFLLFPGVGTQGGDTKGLLSANALCPYLINVSRDVIYPAGDGDFAEKVENKAKHYQALFNEIDSSISK